MSHNYIADTIKRSILFRILFPALLLLFCLLLYRQMPLTDRLHPVSMTMYDDFRVQYQTDTIYAAIDTAPRLLYDTGVVQNRGPFSSGHYYYTFLDGRSQLYMLNPSEAEHTRLTGHLAMLDDQTYSEIASALAGAIGWDKESLQDFLSPYYFVSNPLFDGKQVCFYLALLLCSAVACVDLVRVVIYRLLPLFRKNGSQGGKG